MVLAIEIGAPRLKAKSDSQLVTNQVIGKYQAKESQLIKYIHKVQSLSTRFTSFEVEYVHREQNSRAYLFSKFSSSKTTGFNRTIIQETLNAPSTKAGEIYALEATHESSWMSHILRYPQEDELL